MAEPGWEPVHAGVCGWYYVKELEDLLFRENIQIFTCYREFALLCLIRFVSQGIIR